jgi:hypothetical protein
MQIEHPDTFNIVSTREELSLLFGKEEELAPGGTCQTVHLTDRIIMTPQAAKRLSLLLTGSLRDYEARFGQIDISSNLIYAESKPARSHVLLPFDAMEMARLIVDLVGGLGVRFGMEWSFKMFAKTILANRLLAGINKQTIKTDPDGRIMDLCREMEIPGPFLEIIRKEIPFADFVHFGFEETQTGGIYKVYLEFKGMCEGELRAASHSPNRLLLFLGLKWDPLHPEKKAVTEYIWHPAASETEIRTRISGIFAGSPPEMPMDTAAGVLSMAAAKMPVKEMYLLEVSEPGNPRKSFDLNVYPARIQLKSLERFFPMICNHYEINPVDFQTFISPMSEKILDHLTGGIDREGRDFLTFYYGVEEGRLLQGKNLFRPL